MPNFTYGLASRTAADTWPTSLFTLSRRQSASFMPLPYFLNAAWSANRVPFPG